MIALTLLCGSLIAGAFACWVHFMKRPLSDNSVLLAGVLLLAALMVLAYLKFGPNSV